MADIKSPLVKHLMEQMGVTDIVDLWNVEPVSKTLTTVNAQIGVQLGMLEDEHRAMRDNLERLGKQQAGLLADLSEGVRVDAMWINHYSNKIVACEASVNRVLNLVRELMHVRSVLVAELLPAAAPVTEP